MKHKDFAFTPPILSIKLETKFLVRMFGPGAFSLVFGHIPINK